MKVSIVIPVKNEEKTIISVLDNIRSKIKTEFEVLIVYDNKSDPTCTKTVRYISKHRLKNIRLLQNENGNGQGVINAIKTGIKRAGGKAVVITMADLSDNIKQVDEMYSLINKGYDIVAASRYMPGGKKIGGTFLKTFLSKSAGISLHKIFKVPTHDATNAFKMYKASIFNEIEIKSTGGFEYSLEITIKAFKKGHRITEIPTDWHDREAGKSNFKLSGWLPKYIKTYLLILKRN